MHPKETFKGGNLMVGEETSGRQEGKVGVLIRRQGKGCQTKEHQADRSDSSGARVSRCGSVEVHPSESKEPEVMREGHEEGREENTS